MNLATKVLNKPIGTYVATLPFIDIKKYLIKYCLLSIEKILTIKQ